MIILKNKIFNKILAFILLFVIFGIGSVNAEGLPANISEVHVINYVKKNESKIKMFNNNNINYVRLDELYNLISNTNIEVKKISEETYEIKSLNGAGTINTKDDSLYSNNYVRLFYIPDEEDKPSIVPKADTKYSGNITSTTIDFNKYNIDLYGDGNSVWLPITSAFDMLMSIGYYDGENVYIFDNQTAVDHIQEDDYLDVIKKNFVNGTRFTYNTINYYDELCFILDNFYGYPSQSTLAESIKKNGLDYTLEHYDEDTKDVKTRLLSSKFDDFFVGLMELDAYLYDGGHTSVTGATQNILPDPFKYFDYDDKASKVKKYSDQVKIESSKTSSEQNIKENRKKIDNNYIELGDTALYIFDEFNLDSDAWKDYYNNKKEYPDDVLGNLLSALDKASSNPNIKNFVFDISNNGGGLGVLAPIIMDFLGYDNNLQFLNTINNQLEQNILDTDINFDKVYDEKDRVSKYNFNYAVLTSKNTFSTANLFASLAKENKFMLLGEKTSGGACAISMSFTNENVFYSISSPLCLVDNNGASIDGGIEVDANLVVEKDGENDYSKYYDLTLLSQLINEYYGNVENNIEIKEIKDNALNANIVNNNDKINNIIELSNEDKKLLLSGKKMSIFVEVQEINPSEEDKKLINDILENKYNIGLYLDINLFKQIENNAKEKITNTKSKVKISLEIPQALRNTNRKFHIVKVHNGDVSIITPSVEGNILTFESDEFSTYALIYVDEQINTPNTKDNILLYIFTFVLSLIGIVVTQTYAFSKKND